MAKGNNSDSQDKGENENKNGSESKVINTEALMNIETYLKTHQEHGLMKDTLLRFAGGMQTAAEWHKYVSEFKN